MSSVAVRTRYSQPHPASGRRPARRPARKHRGLKTMLLFLVLVVGAALVAQAYVLSVYAPGLKAEAARIPSDVRAQLALQSAPYTPLSQISPNLRHAIVAVEDRRFYQHPGVDPIGLIRASVVNAFNRHIDQGGSTLEEQLVKRAIVGDDHSIRGKLRTIALAWAVDQDFRKPQILELYLNAAYYGQGAYGAEEAARVYFGTSSGALTPAQAAFLAALPQAPSVYGAHPRAAPVVRRWKTVLADMRSMGYLSAAQESQALQATLSFALPNP